MRYSIKNSFLILAALFITVSVFAQRGQGQRSPEERAAKMTEHMTRTLDLNEDQAEKVKAIHLKYAAEMKAFRSKEGNKEEKRTAMQQMRTELDKEMKSVLNQEQYDKLKAMPNKRMKSRHGYGKGRKNHGHDKAFKEKAKPILLDKRVKLESKISAEDKVEIVQIRSEMKAKRAERKALHKQYREKGERPGEDEIKKRKADRKNDPNRQKLKTLAEKYQSDIDPLFEEIEPQLKTLKEEMRPAQGDPQSKSRKSNEKRKKRDGEVKKEKKHLKRYGRFLLLDPSEPVKE